MTRLAIEKNRITAIALLVILGAGLNAYRQLPRSEDPGFIVRTAQVTTRFPGASPVRVEQLVTDKLEKVIQEIPELDSVTSTSKTGVSVVMVNIQERYKEMRPIWDSLRRKVDRSIADLPDGIREPEVNDEFGDVFGTVVTLTGDGYSYAELKDIADEVRDELLRIDEVAKVEVHGAQEERVFVEYKNARLSELGLSALQLQSILESRNIIIPGGDIRTDDERIVLEPSGSFESVEDLRQTLISVPGGAEVVALEDIARVERGYIDPPRNKVLAAEAPAALALAVSMREGGNILTLGAAVEAMIGRLQVYYPYGVDFDFVQAQADAVAKKVDEFVGSLLQAVVIVVAVMLLFLGLRTGLIVSSLIPMAIVMALMVMGFFGIGLDQMSLASLIIALGMLVDNAIVMSESIMVARAAGKGPLDAAVDSAAELRVPLLTSSLTTAAAFLPIFLAKSSTGEYTAPLFKVVTITLLSSWLLSLTMIPMLCYFFLKVEVREESFSSRFYRGYRRALLAGLRRPLLSLAVVAAIFLVVMRGFALIPAIFFPPNDRPTLTCELELPTGTPIERTEEVARQVERYIATLKAAGGGDGVTNWAGFLGQGAPKFMLSYNPEPPSPEYGIFVVNATSRATVDELVAKIAGFCLQQFPDLKATVRPLPLGPPVTNPVEVRISGRDQDEIFAIVDRVKAKLGELDGPRNISDNWGQRSKKLVVAVDEARARRAGVTNQDVALSLQTAMTGITTTEYREGDKVIPVTLRSEAAERQDIGKIESLNVFAQLTGRAVPLKQVADVELAWQPAKIRRRQRLQTVTVTADLAPGVTATSVNSQLQPWLDEQKQGWPVGYDYEFGGEDEASNDANASIGEQLPVAGLIILLLLVGQFNSLRRPAIIIITIPLGLIGVVIGLLLLRSYFGFMTFLGVISLAGIVINNAIVLLDRIRIEREDNGLPPQRAVLESAQRRLRPILLTTATTIFGLLPLYLGGGPMWEPMAIAIMFGLLFATGLTLGVVPILYALFFRVSFRGYDP